MSRRDIDPDALRVLYRLSDAGFLAYLVGGSVRDLLLGKKPKDFDVSTDAHPSQVRRLFRNCFLVGRRFRLAHIRFGAKVIETSTFRRQPDAPADPAGGRLALLQHHDNTFGTPEEDARRRDFTVNGLFYDIRTFNVIDYVGGLADLEARRIRCIGDPDIRYQEDPVRMIRAIRFAARLGFDVEPGTYEGILRHHAAVRHCAAPRLQEEVLRLFAFRSSSPAFRLLHRSGLMDDLLPEISEHLREAGPASELLWRCLAALDARPDGGAPPGPALAVSVLCYPAFRQRAQPAPGRPPPDAAAVARDLVLPLAVRYHMAKHVAFQIVHLLAAQPLLDSEPKPGARTRRFVNHESFPDALALQELRVAAQHARHAAAAAWRDLASQFRRERSHGPHLRPHGQSLRPHPGRAPESVPPRHAEGLPDGGQPRRRRRRRGRGGRPQPSHTPRSPHHGPE